MLHDRIVVVLDKYRDKVESLKKKADEHEEKIAMAVGNVQGSLILSEARELQRINNIRYCLQDIITDLEEALS